MAGNRKVPPNPIGRPPRFKTPEEFDAKAAAYFKRARRRPTINGLTLFLGFCSKDSLYELGKKPAFTDSVKRARCQVEQGYESCLYNQFCSGPIFALKNFGWSDRQEIEHSGAVTVGPGILLPAGQFPAGNGHPTPTAATRH